MAKNSKNELRRSLRVKRQEHVNALPDSTRALLFLRPPRPVTSMIPSDAVIGLYHATLNEAPAAAYARFFYEAGHKVALPRFAAPGTEMDFATFSDPFGESDLEPGPYKALQPGSEALALIPDVLFTPLLGFTVDGHRLGQGGGHYDRWLDAHPGTIAIGLAWDCQLVDQLPLEPHDHPLKAVVTPTRLYGPF
ncbi:5-formyltetrahydrofolate cyclo-ligase [Croceicoccus estronivorus]|uniref:5-formyltetrahydrofolate cyclo-ligase n=1 Tax=Croceicoccus estronivorus TaxID=1172626 RepID=UPI00082D260C|nr:5-formyltetrahydrofolate cyclo-ligase [Croceicoccus estronivorus]OCC24791.1 5-formyltetrahydrofolate cyclo-ligase [Croceicoccus estronivorus]